MKNYNKILDELKNNVSKSRDNNYIEMSPRTFTIYTSFRIADFIRSDGKHMYDVEYRNPSDEKWKCCRCEETYSEAYQELLNLIDKINRGDFDIK